MIRVRYLGLVLSTATIFGTAAVYAQDSSAPADSTQQRKQLPSQPVPRSSDPDENSSPENPRTVTAPPRDDGESSSRDQIIDLSPPANDVKEHPESEVPDEEVTEFHKWDPHKAQKSVEVGDFYLKQKNYKAAIDRYREALEYKPNDAIATLHLAQALEQSRNIEEARKEYVNYLKILPHGPNAAEARRALERLPKTAVNRPPETSPQKP